MTKSELAEPISRTEGNIRRTLQFSMCTHFPWTHSDQVRSVLIVRQCETVTGCALASSDLVILHMFILVLSEESCDHP